MDKKEFGILADGSAIDAYTLQSSDVTAVILTYGGRIQSLRVGGRDIVCGFDTLEDYVNDNSYQGAIIGRYANRISEGTFMLNGKKYVLAKNDKGLNHNQWRRQWI